MLKRKLDKQIGMRTPSRRRRRIILAAGLLLSLTCGGALAQWSGLISVTQKNVQKGRQTTPKKEEKGKEIAPAALTPSTPSKEYIYVGGKLTAIEEP